MRWAIIPVFCQGTERQTTISKAWLERAGRAVDAYYHRQSGSRANLACTVFDWREIELTPAGWMAAGQLAGRKVYEKMAEAGVLSVGDFDHFVVLIDDAVSSSGVTPHAAPETSLIAARSITPTLVAHELGHRLDLWHTYLQGRDGPIEYGGQFCVMGAEGGKHSFIDHELLLPEDGASAANAQSGPGMCFANLVNAGWTDPDLHAVRVHANGGGPLSLVIGLAALDGAPQAGGAHAPIACIIENDNYWHIIEYRSSPTHYDQGVPGSVAPVGSLVFYRTPPNSPLVPLQVASTGVAPGSILSIGGATAFDETIRELGGTPGLLLQATILSVDPGGREVSLRIERRSGRPPLYERTDDIMDFLQWAIAGRELDEQVQGSVLPAVQALTQIHHLSRQVRLAGERDAAALRPVIDQKQKELRELVSRMGP